MANEVDEFLNGTGEKKESSDPFKDVEVTVPEEKEEIVEEEKIIPFNKDPKVQKYIDKEISKRLEGIKPTKEVVSETKSETDDLVAAFTTIIGNDTPEKKNALSALQNALNRADDRASEKAVAKLESMREQEMEAEVQAEEEAVNEIETGFENIADTFGIDLDAPQNKKTRNDFIDFIRRVAPKDSDGDVSAYPDFEETFRLFQDTTKRPSRAKDLASRSMARSGESTAPASQDKSWDAVDRMFNKLS